MQLNEKTLKKLQSELKKWFSGERKKLKENRPILNSIHFEKKGNVELTNSHVAIRITEVHSEPEHTIPDSNGAFYPELGRIFEGCLHGNIQLELDTKEMVGMLSPFLVDKVEVVKLYFRKDGIEFEPWEDSVIQTATLTTQLNLDEEFKVAVNVKYLHDAMMFFKTQRIKTVTMIASTPVRPVLFEHENLQYLITPVRVN